MKRIYIACLLSILWAGMSLPLSANQSAGTKALRVVSLAPSTTDILFAIGLDKEIVGVSQNCDYPDAALNKEKVGTFSNPNIEKILSLRPDLIFCAAGEQAATISKLRQLGLKVCVSDPVTMEELYSSIAQIGELTGHGRGASELISSMRKDVDIIRAKVELVPEEKRPRVFVEIWHDPLMTAGKGSFIDDLITLAGGVNIAGDTDKPYTYFSAEEVIHRDPQCIIIGYMNKNGASALIKKRAGWENISALKYGRVYGDLNPDVLFRPGSRSASALKELYRRIYPS